MNLGKESETLEFKKSTGELKEGIVSLASMLNKNGFGTLYFGVKNNGDVIGQEIGENTLRDISQAIAANIKPQAIPTISLNLMNDMNVIKVEIEGKDKPYSSYGKYYIRSADEDRELLPNGLKNLLERNAYSDEITEIKSSKHNLTFNRLKDLYKNNGLSINESEFERNNGLLNSKNEYNLMAELLADENDFSIKVAVFSGTDKTNIILRNEFGFKSLPIAMDEVLSFVSSLNETKVTLTNHARKEEKLFDFAVFKEAWQNACVHTKWALKNPPAVYIFSNRIEIISTGGLLADLSEDEFFKGVSRPVNEKLQKIFGQLGLVEQTGHGIPLIIKNYGKKAFDIMEHYINVTIPFTRDRLRLSTLGEHNNKKLNNSQEKVVDYLKDNPDSTIANIVGGTGFSNGYVRKILGYLKDNDYLERIGANKNGYWHIK